MECISSSIDGANGEEQRGFMEGKRCVDQLYGSKQGDIYGFHGFEKAYDRIGRDTMTQVLRIYGMGRKLLIGIQSSYSESRECVGGEFGMCEWFYVKVGLRQGCAMSPWLFNVYMDGIVREVNAKGYRKRFEVDRPRGKRLESESTPV